MCIWIISLEQRNLKQRVGHWGLIKELQLCGDALCHYLPVLIHIWSWQMPTISYTCLLGSVNVCFITNAWKAVQTDQRDKWGTLRATCWILQCAGARRSNILHQFCLFFRKPFQRNHPNFKKLVEKIRLIYPRRDKFLHWVTCSHRIIHKVCFWLLCCPFATRPVCVTAV